MERGGSVQAEGWNPKKQASALGYPCALTLRRGNPFQVFRGEAGDSQAARSALGADPLEFARAFRGFGAAGPLRSSWFELVRKRPAT